jgi:hypothetical protein
MEDNIPYTPATFSEEMYVSASSKHVNFHVQPHEIWMVCTIITIYLQMGSKYLEECHQKPLPVT